MRLTHRIRFGGGIVAALCITLSPLTFMHQSSADAATSPWLVTTPPVLDKLADLAINESPPYSINGNRDCYQRKVITRPRRQIPIWPFLQTESSYTSCVVDTAYGSIDTRGLLQRPGGTMAGLVSDINGRSAILVPIPHSTVGMMMTGSTSNASYLGFFDNMEGALNSTAIYTGEVLHKVSLPQTVALSDKSGKSLAANTDSLSFSANGDWMVADIPGIGAARINTQSRQVLPFGDVFNYGIGISPGLQTAISADGRYAVVASRSFGVFKLYDLSTCGPVPDNITGKVACGSRDLKPVMQHNVPGYLGVSQLRFRGNYALDMHVDAKPGATQQKSHQVLRASGQTNAGFQYMALGDSFASGEGAYQYKASTDTNINKCHLSQRSYPYLISAELDYDQYESVSCSGASIDDLNKLDEDYKGQTNDGVRRKERNLEEILGSFSPGYIEQKAFVSRNLPNIITLSAGGNDIGFSDRIKRCLDSDTCYNSYEDRRELVDEINQQFKRLVDLYAQIKNVSDPTAKIYVIGYPQFADPDGNCARNVHLNHDELVFSGQLISQLNSVIKTAAANAGVFYVDVENAFDGHRHCETVSSNVAMNGLTLGNDLANIPFVHGPIGNESFHPNAMGHRLFKTAVLEKTNTLTAPMPAPNPSAILPDISDNLPILQVPKANRTLRITKTITGTEGGVIEFGTTWLYEYNPSVLTLKASSKVKAWLNSDPVFLGEFTVATDGSVTAGGQLPDNIPAGFHTLHLYGQNTSGEDMDIYQTVYVAADAPQGQCIVVPDSGEDIDQDNIDDACDPLIDEPPIVVELPPADPDPVEPTPEVTQEQVITIPPTEDTETITEPKPPENNPETVASATQGTPQTAVLGYTTPQPNQAVTQAETPAGSNTQNSTPQVAAASTQNITTSPPPTNQPTTATIAQQPKPKPWLKALAVLLIIATIFVIIKLQKHPPK